VLPRGVVQAAVKPNTNCQHCSNRSGVRVGLQAFLLMCVAKEQWTPWGVCVGLQAFLLICVAEEQKEGLQAMKLLPELCT